MNLKIYALSLHNGHMPPLRVLARDRQHALDKGFRLCRLLGWSGFSRDLLLATEV